MKNIVESLGRFLSMKAYYDQRTALLNAGHEFELVNPLTQILRHFWLYVDLGALKVSPDESETDIDLTMCDAIPHMTKAKVSTLFHTADTNRNTRLPALHVRPHSERHMSLPPCRSR